MIDVIRRMRSGEEAAAQVRLLADGLDAATADADILSAAQRRATESLRRARDDLGRSVHELKRGNEALHAENADRIRAEEALRKGRHLRLLRWALALGLA
jgi:hypothetical protein